jgi:hypothetical protein
VLVRGTSPSNSAVGGSRAAVPRHEAGMTLSPAQAVPLGHHPRCPAPRTRCASPSWSKHARLPRPNRNEAPLGTRRRHWEPARDETRESGYPLSSTLTSVSRDKRLNSSAQVQFLSYSFPALRSSQMRHVAIEVIRHVLRREIVVRPAPRRPRPHTLRGLSSRSPTNGEALKLDPRRLLAPTLRTRRHIVPLRHAAHQLERLRTLTTPTPNVAVLVQHQRPPNQTGAPHGTPALNSVL